MPLIIIFLAQLWESATYLMSCRDCVSVTNWPLYLCAYSTYEFFNNRLCIISSLHDERSAFIFPRKKVSKHGRPCKSNTVWLRAFYPQIYTYNRRLDNHNGADSTQRAYILLHLSHSVDCRRRFFGEENVHKDSARHAEQFRMVTEEQREGKRRAKKLL
jgi:hypothetical protein